MSWPREVYSLHTHNVCRCSNITILEEDPSTFSELLQIFRFANPGGQIVCGMSIMPLSNVVISNQLTGKTGWQEVEKNHLNLRPCHGSPAAEGGQGCRSG